jgi:hypothetical protein
LCEKTIRSPYVRRLDANRIVLEHRRFCARGGSPGRGIWSKERIVAGCRNEDCFEFIASASSNLPFILYQLRSNSGAIGANGPSKARYPKRFRNGILRRHTRGRANGPARIGPSQIRGTLPHFSSRRRARAFSLLRSGFATWGPEALSPGGTYGVPEPSRIARVLVSSRAAGNSCDANSAIARALRPATFRAVGTIASDRRDAFCSRRIRESKGQALCPCSARSGKFRNQYNGGDRHEDRSSRRDRGLSAWAQLNLHVEGGVRTPVAMLLLLEAGRLVARR